MIDELNRCLVTSEFATLTETLHGWIEYENAGEFNRIVLGFINKH